MNGRMVGWFDVWLYVCMCCVEQQQGYLKYMTVMKIITHYHVFILHIMNWVDYGWWLWKLLIGCWLVGESYACCSEYQAKSIERIRWLVLGLCFLPFCNIQEIIIMKRGWLFKVNAPWSATSLPFHSFRSDVAMLLLIWILNTLSLYLLCDAVLCKFMT